MLFKNTESAYGIIAQLIHWLMFLMLAGMVTAGFIMDGLDGPTKIQVIGLHKATGITILTLATLRLFWRVLNPTPRLPLHMPGYQKFAAHAGHWTLYALMFFLPLTGWLMSSAAGFPVSVFGLFTMPDMIEANREMRHFFEDLHETGVIVFLVVAVGHIGAALVHHFYYKDNILKRMLIPSK